MEGTDVNSIILDRYLALTPTEKKTQALYVWIDSTGENIRAKTKTLEFRPTNPNQLPLWNFDGSSTGQAEGSNSDVYLLPVTMYKDPFRPGGNIVLCETLKYNKLPTDSNHRHHCVKIMEMAVEDEPWFGMEQEYMFMDKRNYPYGWPSNGFPKPQGLYYCSVGASKINGRDIVEAHYRACLYCDINISGSNAESLPSQWEYQIGPSGGISVSDDVWVSRYLLSRISEDFGVCVSFDPKPIEGSWNGAGLHCNFSTKKMREEGGLAAIEEAIKKLANKHEKHLDIYDPNQGRDNIRRLVGSCQAPSMVEFSSGVADRTATIRIPRDVADNGRGYLEDRRPAANGDPYLVTEILVKTICLND